VQGKINSQFAFGLITNSKDFFGAHCNNFSNATSHVLHEIVRFPFGVMDVIEVAFVGDGIGTYTFDIKATFIVKGL
jgi:hypothetical protein